MSMESENAVAESKDASIISDDECPMLVIAEDDDSESRGIMNSDEEVTASNHENLAASADSQFNRLESFSWLDYLNETKSTAAPQEYFNQSHHPPVNKFELNKKVEVTDHRNIYGDSVCLATIVGVHSIWICVRLDGEDGSNDFWIICDHESIRPVGYCKEVGILLHPPFGFLYNLASFHRFIENQLNVSSDGVSPAAAKECFAPISHICHPGLNKFQAGMKCEAIDHRTFNGRLCPATIVHVSGDYVTVSYDGWNGSYNSEERYDSRHIFPVGWAEKCGIPLQPPRKVNGRIPTTVYPNTDDKVQISRMFQRRGIARKVVNCMAFSRDRSHSNASSSRGSVQHRFRSVTIRRRSNPAKMVPGIQRSDTNRESKDKNPLHSNPAKEYTKIPSGCSSTDKKGCVKSGKRRWKGGVSSSESMVIKSIKKEGCFESGFDLSHVTNSLDEQEVDVVLNSNKLPEEDKKVTFTSKRMVAYFNNPCLPSCLMDSKKLSIVPRKFGPDSFHHVTREVIQQIVNCCKYPLALMEHLDSEPNSVYVITAGSSTGKTIVRYIPRISNVSEAWNFIENFTTKAKICCNIVQKDYSVGKPCCTTCLVSKGTGNVPLYTWSVERVARKVGEKFGREISEKFSSNYIDGHAALLLTTDVMVHYMNMTLGLALKLLRFFEVFNDDDD